MSTQKPIPLDAEQLTQIIAATVAATVAEMRKPEPPTPQELANLRQAQEERKATADSVKEQKDRERWFQEHGCAHEHTGPLRGTHCVYVKDNDVVTSPGFVFCQKCQGRVRPDEPQMKKLDPGAIFDTALFNNLLAVCMQNGAEILG